MRKTLFLVLLILSVASVSGSVNLTDGLIRYYSLDETSGTVAANSIALTNNGTANNARVFTAETVGVINTSANLSQGNDYIAIPSWNHHQRGSSGYSYSLWVKPASLSSLQILFNTNYFSFQTTTSQPSGTNGAITDGFVVRDYTGSVEPILGYSDIDLHQWYHLVAVYNTTHLIFYVNGTLVDSAPMTAVASATSRFHGIGGYSQSSQVPNQLFFTGAIDEVAIYDRPLSSDEVEALWADGDGLAYPFSSGDPEPSLGLMDYYVIVTQPQHGNTFGSYVAGSEIVIRAEHDGFDDISCEYTRNGGSSWFDTLVTINDSHVYYVEYPIGSPALNSSFRCREGSGEWVTTDFLTLNIDNTAPSISYSPSSASAENNITVTINVTDTGAGVNESTIEYCVTSSSTCDDYAGSGSSVFINTTGSWTVCARAEDNVGNIGASCTSPGAYTITGELFEVFVTITSGSGTWTPPIGITSFDVLVVAGGGGSGYQDSTAQHRAGGGGAGGLIYIPQYNVTPGANFSYGIGLGGLGGTASTGTGVKGGNTIFGSLTAIGGGGGGRSISGSTQSGSNGGSAGAPGRTKTETGFGCPAGAGTAQQPLQSGDSGLFGYGHTSSRGTGECNSLAEAYSGGGAGGPGRGIDGSTPLGGLGLVVFGEEYARGGGGDGAGDSARDNRGDGGRAPYRTTAGSEPGSDGIIVLRLMVPEYILLSAVDNYDNTSIEFNATIANNTYESSGGSIIILSSDLPEVFDVEFNSTEYFGLLLEGFNKTEQSYEARLTQAFATFDCRELYTNNSLTCEPQGGQSRKAGSYEESVSVEGYYPISFSYNLSALDDEVFLVEGFYSLNLTVAPSSFDGSPANFTVKLNNTILGLTFDNTSNGESVNYALLSGYDYDLNVTQTTITEGIDIAPYLATITNTTTPPQNRTINATIGAARTLTFNFYYEENLTLFENEVKVLITPIDDTTVVFYELNSSTGSAEIINVAVGRYQLVMKSEGYLDEYRYVNLGGLTSADFNAYFRENDTGEVKTFNVVDRRNLPMNGWFLKAQRYYNATGWVTVDEGRSNIDGTLLINLLSDEFYRVILLDDEFTVQYTSQRTFLPASTYEVSPSITTATNSQILRVLGVQTDIRVLSNENGSVYFEANGYSTSGSRDWTLELYRYYRDGPILIDSSSASGDAITLTVDVPEATARYEAVLTITGSKIPVASLGYSWGGGPQVIGSAGGIFAFLLLIAIVGVGTFSAPVAIVMSIVALIVANLIGVFSIGVAAIVGLIFAGGLILYRRNA